MTQTTVKKSDQVIAPEFNDKDLTADELFHLANTNLDHPHLQWFLSYAWGYIADKMTESDLKILRKKYDQEISLQCADLRNSVRLAKQGST